MDSTVCNLELPISEREWQASAVICTSPSIHFQVLQQAIHSGKPGYSSDKHAGLHISMLFDGMKNIAEEPCLSLP